MTRRNDIDSSAVEDGETKGGGRIFDSRRLHTFPQTSPDVYGESVPPGQDPAQILPKKRRAHGFCWCGAARPPGRLRFCTDDCGRKYWAQRKAARIPAVCEHCQRDFMALKEAVRKGGGRFCSVRCCGDHAAATGKFAGDRNPRWLGGVSNDNMRYRRRQIERWPGHEAARRAVAREVRAGRMVHQPCERCGATTKVEGHHDDYSKPLEVRWLCPTHHDEVHAELKAAAR